MNKKGFTLIELLIVIGIIAILAAIIFVAVDPARRLAEARNAERWSSVNAILNSYLQYTVDNAGTTPGTITPGVTYMIGNGADATGCTASTTVNIQMLNDLDDDLVDTYISSVPVDPSGSGAGADKTYYFLYRSPAGRVTVGACVPEAVGGTTPNIRVSR